MEKKLSNRMDHLVIEQDFHSVVSALEGELHPLVAAELSVLVDILYQPHLLFLPGSEAHQKCAKGGFISRLIRHCEKLLDDKDEKLCIEILRVLKDMITVSHFGPKGDALRERLLSRCLCSYPDSRGESLDALLKVPPFGKPEDPIHRQCHLAEEGAADLVVELVMKSKSIHSIFAEAVSLGIALLEGGNTKIQQMLFNKLVKRDKTQTYFMTKCKKRNRKYVRTVDINGRNALQSEAEIKNKINKMSETLSFLDCICGSTTGGIGLLGLYINEQNVSLINQTLETLTEYCQGPCHENQNCIATHESNGLHIITALLLSDVSPLSLNRMDLVLKLKNNASKLLLAIMESRADSDNVDRILHSMNKPKLLEVVGKAFHQTSDEGSAGDNSIEAAGVSPKEVGHNIYILCHQLAKHNSELRKMLHARDGITDSLAQALAHYRDNTAQIEINTDFNHIIGERIVRSDRTLEQIVFPIRDTCLYLTNETKHRVYHTAQLDLRGSKVTDFFKQFEDMHNEMKWQRDLKNNSALSNISNHMSLWSRLLFLLGLICNVIIAAFYPFDEVWEHSEFISVNMNVLLWLIFLLLSGVLYSMTFQPVLLYSYGFVFLKIVHLASIMGNKGTFAKGIAQAVIDKEILFDVVYREETLLNVINSVTRNGWSIILTAALALILAYMFSIVGFLLFQDDFTMTVSKNELKQIEPSLEECDQSCEADSVLKAPLEVMEVVEVEERVCTSLRMCIVTTLNHGLRNGGGIGDILRVHSSEDKTFVYRVLYDLCFFFVIIIIILNLIFGVIIDTFADLRSEKQQKEDRLQNTCFICGLNRSCFDNKAVTFEEHCRYEHNHLHYLYFYVLVMEKDTTEFTGPESYVYALVKAGERSWFPHMQAMSLAAGEAEGEANEVRNLNAKLDKTQVLLDSLISQLNRLKEEYLI
ncbi:Ryanodine receptor 1 [Armadillidium vulgare]|nr:Ryanodine receptor 1 [Armadillidium vulgare]